MQDRTSAGRILVVEERPGGRDLLRLVLGRLHYRVLTVGTPEEALVRVSDGDFAVAIVSATLPAMPFADFVERLRAIPQGEHLPVLAICPDSAGTKRACLEAGAVDVLFRPLEIEHLLRLVERFTRGCRAASAADALPVMDLDHLRSFTDGDSQLERELASLFLSSAQLYVGRMREALERGEPWSRTAHALKGASANLGARRLSHLARAAEHADPCPDQLAVIERAVDELRRFFRARQT